MEIGVGFLIMIFTICWSAWNWYTELQPFMTNRYRPKKAENWTLRIFQAVWILIVNLKRFIIDGKWFIIDMLASIFFVSIFAFGGSFLGAIAGLFIGNCVSLILIKYMTIDLKEQGYNVNFWKVFTGNIPKQPTAI